MKIVMGDFLLCKRSSMKKEKGEKGKRFISHNGCQHSSPFYGSDRGEGKRGEKKKKKKIRPPSRTALF